MMLLLLRACPTAETDLTVANYTHTHSIYASSELNMGWVGYGSRIMGFGATLA